MVKIQYERKQTLYLTCLNSNTHVHFHFLKRVKVYSRKFLTVTRGKLLAVGTSELHKGTSLNYLRRKKCSIIRSRCDRINTRPQEFESAYKIIYDLENNFVSLDTIIWRRINVDETDSSFQLSLMQRQITVLHCFTRICSAQPPMDEKQIFPDSNESTNYTQKLITGLLLVV
jgi:hypothetical protein